MTTITRQEVRDLKRALDAASKEAKWNHVDIPALEKAHDLLDTIALQF